MPEQPPPTYPEYAGLLADAEESVRRDGMFIDPAKLHRYQLLRRPFDWCRSILGHDRAPSVVEMHLILLADERGIDPPLPAWLAERRAAQKAKADAEKAEYDARIRARSDAWAALAAALPVSVTLAYNYSGPNHYETYAQGAVHIILLEELRVGRLHRVADWALCTTNSAARHQHFPWPDTNGEHGWPTCRACVRQACRITGLEAPALMAD